MLTILIVTMLGINLTSCGDDKEDDATTINEESPTYSTTYCEYNNTTFFKIPCLEWGASMTKIKSFMNGYTVYKTTDNVIIYNGKFREKYIGYSFENNCLKACVVYLDANSLNVESASYWGKTGWKIVQSYSNRYLLISPDEKTGLLAETISNNNNIEITYTFVPATDNNAKARYNLDFEGLF